MVIYHQITSFFIRRPPTKRLQTIIKRRYLTEAIATLRLSPDKMQQVRCTVEGAPDYTVTVPKHVGCDLAGRDLGPQMIKTDLIFYGGRHFAYDNGPQSPRLTLSEEVAKLIEKHSSGDKPAALYHGGAAMEGSAICLKETEGEQMMDFTAQGVRRFSKALKEMK